jgi:hypothetical protein
MGPQIADLQEVVAQPEGRALRQVVQALPIAGRVTNLKLQMILQAGDPLGSQPLEDGSPRCRLGRGYTQAALRAVGIDRL